MADDQLADPLPVGPTPPRAGAEPGNPPGSAGPLHLQYELSRRQAWAAHFGVWLASWKTLLAVHAVVAGVVALAWWTSWWFLLILGLGFLPPIDNFWRWVGGIVGPLVWRPRMDIVIDGDRIGADVRGYGREWLPFSEIRRVERHGDVWSVVFDRVGVDIPVSLIDGQIVGRMRALMTPDR